MQVKQTGRVQVLVVAREGQKRVVMQMAEQGQTLSLPESASSKKGCSLPLRHSESAEGTPQSRCIARLLQLEGSVLCMFVYSSPKRCCRGVALALPGRIGLPVVPQGLVDRVPQRLCFFTRSKRACSATRSTSKANVTPKAPWTSCMTSPAAVIGQPEISADGFHPNAE